MDGLRGQHFRELLNRWRKKQEPPWPWKYIAQRLGYSEAWLYKIGNTKYRSRPGPELAYKVQVMTGGEIQMIDVLLDPETRARIDKEMSPNVN